MKNCWKAALVIGAVLIAFVVFQLVIPSDEERVRRVLQQIVREINARDQGGNIGNVVSANRIADFFTPEFEIHINAPGVPELDIRERSELIQILLSMKDWRRRAKVELLDLRTTIISQAEAIVDATGKAEVSGESEVFVSELRFTLVKVDQRWRIRQVESVPTFQ